MKRINRLKGIDLRIHINLKLIVSFIVIVLFLSGCFRGRPSEDPPIHINPNMDDQPKYKAQSESQYFENGSSMRMPVAGTVARGEEYEDTRYYFGKDAKGNPIAENPVPITIQLLKRGQNRFNIYCAPCHGQTGDGQGIVVKRGYLPPPNFHQDLVRNYPDGHIFDVITNGIRNMPSYKHMIPVADRWAIVSYVRALQRSENATLSDIPEEIRNEIK
jgi:mono/diheme cytochrome c family protein